MNMRLKSGFSRIFPTSGSQLFATKLGQAMRIAPGADFFRQGAAHDGWDARCVFHGCAQFPSARFCVGVLGAAAIRLTVYVKGKNAKKFSQNTEYGSPARWSV